MEGTVTARLFRSAPSSSLVRSPLSLTHTVDVAFLSMSRAVPGGSAPKRPGASSRGQLQPKKRKINDTQDLSRASKADEEAKKAKEECSGVSGDLRHQPREPSKTEWKEMHHVNPVAWSTSEHDQTTYEIGQDVVIVPHYRDIKKSKKNADKMLKFEDLWYGRILDMRCGDLDHPDDVWLKVAWHYSPAWFMTTKARGTRLKDFGPYELIYTPTHTDLIHADSLNGVEKIFPYDEEDHDQQDIPDKAFHVRSIYDTTDKEWIVSQTSSHYSRSRHD
ncbi:hypothetical protein CALCODRAFT_261174 [Calocera cornea HHB12733]|uniref:BAH domain-containing protein n=1 Tax=Calocera cornea HHB12733 TaxID=1353952 RepID=A0A165GJ06_9BASI|nr:hypothetical protein CALCODRAFT_261174 [Calocera cornea HHB12733]